MHVCQQARSRQKVGRNFVRADDLAAESLQQSDDHFQHGIVAAAAQCSQDEGNLSQEAQRRANLTPLGPPPDGTGKNDAGDRITSEAIPHARKVTDRRVFHVESGPFGAGSSIS